MLSTLTAIALLIVFVVPGYVWRTCQGMFVYQDRKLIWEKFALSLLTRSAFFYIPISPWLWIIWNEKWFEKFPLYAGFCTTSFVFLLPACVGLLHGLSIQSGRINRFLEKLQLQTRERQTPPSAWDTIFGRTLSPGWVLVTLTDGSQVYGYQGGPGADSCFSSDSDNRDLFLSHTYRRHDKGDWKLVENTGGVYVSAKNISVIEFIADVKKTDPS